MQHNISNGVHKEYEGEKSLKELLLTLWSERKLIVKIMATVLAVAGVYTFFIAKTEYEATSELMITIPEQVETRYGTYVFPSSNTSDYVQYVRSNEVIDHILKKKNDDALRESVRQAISVEQFKDQNTFKITTLGRTAEEAKALNDLIVQQYMSSLRISYKLKAIDYFSQRLSVESVLVGNQIMVNKKNLEKLKILLENGSFKVSKANVPDALAITGQDVVDFFAEQEYVNAQLELIKQEQRLHSINELKNDLTQEKQMADKLFGSEEEGQILNGKLDVFASNVMIVTKAYLPESPIAPRKALNLAVAVVLGLVIGVFVVFFSAYWKEN